MLHAVDLTEEPMKKEQLNQLKNEMDDKIVWYRRTTTLARLGILAMTALLVASSQIASLKGVIDILVGTMIGLLVAFLCLSLYFDTKREKSLEMRSMLDKPDADLCRDIVRNRKDLSADAIFYLDHLLTLDRPFFRAEAIALRDSVRQQSDT